MIDAPRISPISGPDQLDSERLALREAAEGFEAIMVRKMLEAARSSSLAEDTPLTGGGRQQFETMRDEHFAEIAARSGTLGFARSIEEQLAQFLDAKGEG
ncbi:flagellar protein FlgJ-like protein [Erythrobacter sp. NAP1]|uniref:rod-binding protein n=1 Tax=Erythrobacter sp. NAP1 TaxID=237727 RepID=UPI000068797E|nr:rod-binding protein [Erythrobacter sp. NAP1]EAQ28883.1 flagellar protein FlgJ-like protein [Erythrobacter sp. NAP1]